jgi:chromosome segregation ATPase
VPRTKLRQTLEELEQELERTGPVDARSRELLEHVVGEVREILERTDEPETQERSLRDRLSQATEAFEVDHPALAETLGRLATALSQLGI